MGQELEKFAATMQQLRGAARRIGSVTPLQAGKTLLKSPEFQEELSRSAPKKYLKQGVPALVGKITKDPEEMRGFTQGIGLQGALSVYTPAQNRMDTSAGDVMMRSLQGQIVMPPKKEPYWDNLGKYYGVSKEYAKGYGPRGPRARRAPPLKDREGLRTLTHLHEGFARTNPPKEILPTTSHFSPRVLMNENNMLAGLRGSQSVDPKKRMIGLRGASKETQGMEKLLQKAYAGRFPYEYGQTKLPKAMRKNLMDRLMAKEIRLPRELKPARETGKTAAAIHYGLGGVAGGIGAIALQILLDRDMRNELITPHTPAAAPIHPQVIRDAAKIAPLLKHLDPAKSRIAIGALPGTGKSQMASELAKRLGMKHHDADLGGGLRSIPEGSIAERYDMLVNEDPEQFDALMHLKRPGAGRIADLVDLPAVDKANQAQFAAARGKTLHPTETAWLKLKPEEGFGTKNLDQSFINKGYVAKKAVPALLGTVAGMIATHLLRK